MRGWTTPGTGQQGAVTRPAADRRLSISMTEMAMYALPVIPAATVQKSTVWSMAWLFRSWGKIHTETAGFSTGFRGWRHIAPGEGKGSHLFRKGRRQSHQPEICSGARSDSCSVVRRTGDSQPHRRDSIDLGTWPSRSFRCTRLCSVFCLNRQRCVPSDPMTDNRTEESDVWMECSCSSPVQQHGPSNAHSINRIPDSLFRRRMWNGYSESGRRLIRKKRSGRTESRADPQLPLFQCCNETTAA